MATKSYRRDDAGVWAETHQSLTWKILELRTKGTWDKCGACEAFTNRAFRCESLEYPGGHTVEGVFCLNCLHGTNIYLEAMMLMATHG